MTNQEFIDAWHKGEEVKVVEMGGIGKGYEIAIWEFAVQCLNVMENTDPFDWTAYDLATDADKRTIWEAYRNHQERGAYDRGEEKGPLAETLDLLGLSGAQWSAGWNAASMFSRHGYDEAMRTAPADRHIKLSKGGLSLNPEDLVQVE